YQYTNGLFKRCQKRKINKYYHFFKKQNIYRLAQLSGYNKQILKQYPKLNIALVNSQEQQA
ncbi:hypothetical protein J0N23_01655, partial [Listeria monocytogenes]|nr:hypothetical protein [Listeria monocytogenes]